MENRLLVHWLVLVLGFPVMTWGQRAFMYPKWQEIGIGAYATNYSGDLAPDHISMAGTRWGASIFSRYHFSPTIQLRGSFAFLRLAGDDRNYPPNAERSFRFQTNLAELSAQMEITLVNIVYDAPRQNITYYIAPYVFAGVGGARFSPRLTYYGPENKRPLYEREPIPEGGRASHTAVVFPFGGGVRFMASNDVSISAEVCARPAPTDLIDGVSLNGNPKRKDWYYTAGLTCSYFLNGPWYPKNR